MENDGEGYPPQDMGWVAIQNAVRETIQSIKELELACSQLPPYVHRSISELLQTSNGMLQAAKQGTSTLEATQPEKLLHVNNDVHSMEFSSYIPAIYLPVLQRQKKRKPSKVVRTSTGISSIKTSPNLRLNQ